MFEKILKLYVMAMLGDIRSPTPHLFGPPGCGKSTVVEMLAAHVGKKLHVINVSRLSPLDVEGVQMPHGDGEDMALRMLPATFWTGLREGDILLLDEFLRGFPEVYNALLDILTSRRAGEYYLPKVFIIAASNTTVAYDKALEDRLLHLPVPDVRTKKSEQKHMGRLIVDTLGLMPEMVESYEMQTLITTEVAPMYEILDQLKGKGSSSAANVKGNSVRKLIGMAQLREVQSNSLKELIEENNKRASQKGLQQHIFLLSGTKITNATDVQRMRDLVEHPKMTDLQRSNLQINLQLIEMETERINNNGTENDDDDDGLDDLFN